MGPSWILEELQTLVQTHMKWSTRNSYDYISTRKSALRVYVFHYLTSQDIFSNEQQTGRMKSSRNSETASLNSAGGRCGLDEISLAPELSKVSGDSDKNSRNGGRWFCVWLVQSISWLGPLTQWRVVPNGRDRRRSADAAQSIPTLPRMRGSLRLSTVCFCSAFVFWEEPATHCGRVAGRILRFMSYAVVSDEVGCWKWKKLRSPLIFTRNFVTWQKTQVFSNW